MNVVPFVREGLGNSSYLIGLADAKAALVDPDRIVARYLQAAEARGWQITSVFETHLHADFVSGAREVAAATGARIFAATATECRFQHTGVTPDEKIRLDGAEVEAVGSPGHTPEHVSYVFRSGGSPPALFSGGSLIVGGAARTDLISREMTETLTHAQYRTLKTAFKRLPDETSLFPTHGGGSFCSAGEAGERASTLGRERQRNPVLRFQGEEEFVRWFPSTFPAVPAYFSRMRAINQAGPRLRRDIPMPPPLRHDEFEEASRAALVVDVRPKEAYTAAHLPDSLHNGFRDSYAIWLGWLVAADTPLLFVLGDVPLEAVVGESLLVGYERFAGWLAGGLESWIAANKPIASAQLVDAATARQALANGATAVDVREAAELESGYIRGAIHIPLGTLQRELEQVPRDRPVMAYCAHGERATTAVSILERAGFDSLLNLNGGIEAWREAGFTLAAGKRVAPSSGAGGQ